MTFRALAGGRSLGLPAPLERAPPACKVRIGVKYPRRKPGETTRFRYFRFPGVRLRYSIIVDVPPVAAACPMHLRAPPPDEAVRLRSRLRFVASRLAFGADSSHLHAAELRIPGRTGNSGTATRHDAWCTVCCMPEPLGTRDCVKVTPRRKCARIRDSKLSLAGAALSARVSARRPPALCPLAVWLCSHGARMHTRRPEPSNAALDLAVIWR